MIWRRYGFVLLFICISFLSAGLLFMSEPMVGRLLLPLFGGSPAVWNTCILFFQAMLLLGYVYVHLATRKLSFKRLLTVHSILLLVPLAVLPFALPAWADTMPANIPELRILAILTVTIGAPFFVLATFGPLMQYWLASTRHPRAKRPYFLYAASNFGSFIALLAYPFLVEPLVSLKGQAAAWTIGYSLLLLLTFACMITVYRQRDLKAAAKVSKLLAASPWRTRLHWTFLAFLPSSLLIGVTAYITTDVASAPLLWIIPLALYLLTFVVAFGVKRPDAVVLRMAPLVAAGLFATLMISIFTLPLPLVIIVAAYLALFTLIALLAHGRLAAVKPAPARLTEFYLWVAIGGALGGLFNGLLAPLIFNDIYEFRLALLLVLPLLIGAVKPLGKLRITVLMLLSPAILFGVLYIVVRSPKLLLTQNTAAVVTAVALVLVYFLYRYRPACFSLGLIPLMLIPIGVLALQSNVLKERTFFGVIKVTETNERRVMLHGTTQHGTQHLDPQKATEPTTYYHKKGPLGDIMKACQQNSGCGQIGAIGLGTGTVAAYGQTGGRLTFYEIDPKVIEIARNPRYFTYIRDSKAQVTTVLGDARLSLQKDSARHDVLIVDAFSSDAIPVHLLTGEALRLYQERLTKHGLLAVHISNRHLDLEPILKAIAQDQALVALVRYDNVTYEEDNYRSQWVVLARQPADLEYFKNISSWKPLQGNNTRMWTDDYSSILDALR